MEYILIRTGCGYDQYPVEEKFKYKDKVYETEGMEPYQWTQVEEETWMFYMNGRPRYFEHDGMITIADKNADLCIENCGYVATLENNNLTVYRKDSEAYFYWNGRRIELEEQECVFTLCPGDQLLMGTFFFIFFEKYLEVYVKEGEDAIYLAECSSKEVPFEGFPQYTRSPRLIMRVPDKEVDISKPPAVTKMEKGSLIQIIVPPLAMFCVTIAMAIIMKRGLFVIVSAASTVMTIIFSIVRFFNERKDCREKTELREKLYRDYLLKKRKELNRLRQDEINALHYNFPSVHEIEDMIGHYSSRIYEKSADDDDFLTVSVGRRRERVSFPIRYDYDELKMEKDELEEQAKNIKEKFSYIENKPVIIDLKHAHLGLIGEKDVVQEQIKLMVAQLTFQQSYHDLQIVLIHNKEYNDAFSWMDWYPHLKIQSLNLSGDINSERMRDQVLGSLLQILKDRKMKVEESSKQSRFLPHFLFIIDEPKLIMDHSIMEYLGKEGDNLGFSIIYTSHLRGNLPENIGTIVEFRDSEEGTLLLCEDEVINKSFRLNHVGNCDLEWMARNLSVLIHNQGITSNIPESITFFDMYGIKRPEEFRSEERWKKNQSHKSLAVPLGVRAEDDIVYLNLHEKAHGPHGLVAGTTGSGKSEIIQSYILSLAVNFHPYEVGFLLIDYKGGGMAGLFRDLPHLLGTITNLDGSESQRAMASIKSELARRQRIFSQHNVNHINAYNKLYKNGEVKEPIPHLFLISDEFAELKKEQPDFMSELVSTARIGRSLGIHLILATQKPTSVVNDQIWTNSKFKLALKVQDESDSREIIKTPDAAYITQAGRAYLQVGNNEIYELFQSAWSGAEYAVDGKRKTKDNRVYLVNDLGQGELLNEDLSSEEESNELKATQLDVTITYLKQIFEKEGVAKVRKPWLPSLPTMLVSPLHHLPQEEQWQMETTYQNERMPELTIPIGMIDIPEEQAQREYIVDLAKDGNMVFMSSAGYGKTVFLMTAVLSLALQNPVEQLNFYILDFGNSALIPLNGLPHTADYMLYDDTEKFDKFMRIIQDEISARKKLFAEKMVQNFTVYNQTSAEKLKAIVIVVDNFDVVREFGPDTENFFTKVSRDGAGLGIYLIISATRTNGVKYSTLNNFKIKIAGYMFDAMEANTLVGKSEYKLPEVQGRALVKTVNVNIMQIYTMVSFQDDMEYNGNIKALIQKIVAKYPGRRAPRIPVLPETFTYAMLDDYSDNEDPMDLAVGLEVESVTRMGITRAQSPFVIIGETGKGKTNVIKVLLNQMHGRIYLFDSSALSLYSYQASENVEYVQDEDMLEEFVENVKELCERRKQAFKAALEADATLLPMQFYSNEEPVYLVIDDVDNFLAMSKAYEQEMPELLKDAAECGMGIIITVHAAKLKGYDPLSKWVKSAANGLVLSPQGSLNIFPVRTQREYPPMGQGLLFHNGVYEKILIPECK